MKCPNLRLLPAPPENKKGWPWTVESRRLPSFMSNHKPWPKISIVIPSFNTKNFLEESIRSVLLQGYPDLELIIMDGGSTDGTLAIIKKYQKWFAFWESKKDKGQSNAINKGLKKSTGQFFNWHNSDDILTRNNLGRVALALVNHPQAGYVHGYRIIVNKTFQIQGNTKKHYGDKAGFRPKIDEAIAQLKPGTQVGCLMVKKLVDKVGGLDEKINYIIDPDLLLRIVLEKPPYYIPYPTAYLRVYPGVKSLTWNSKRAQERLILAKKIYSQKNLAAKILNVRNRSFYSAHRFACECYRKAGIYHLAFWHFLKKAGYFLLSL